MKKFLSCLMLIFCVFLCFGCNKSTPSISFSQSEISASVGYVYRIHSYDISIKNSQSDVVVSVEDTTIATADGLDIIPLKEGTTRIKFALADDPDVCCFCALNVSSVNFATFATVPNSEVFINIKNQTTAVNKVSFNSDCTEKPEVGYDSSVIDYDYKTGVITAKKIGQTIVQVVFRDCNVSFMVYITEDILVKQLSVNENIVFVGTSGRLQFDLFPSNANTYSFYTLDTSILLLDSSGAYTALAVGNATVYCEYETADGRKLTTFNVVVTESFSDFEFEILQTDGNTAPYYISTREYTLKITLPTTISSSSIRLSSNISATTNITGDGREFSVNIRFNSTGDKVVRVDIYLGDNSTISSTKQVHVWDITDVKIRAKHSFYYIEPDENGVYHVDISGAENAIDYLYFVPVLGENEISETISVFNGVGDWEMEQQFSPTESGTYTLWFQLDGVEIGRVTVVVTK